MSTLSTTIYGNINLDGATYPSPLTITSTGSVNNQGTGDAVYGLNTTAHTLVNSGTITATGVATVGHFAGVYLNGDGSTVSNIGSIGSAGGNGVWIRANGSVTNQGTITGGLRGIDLNTGYVYNSNYIHGDRDGVRAVFGVSLVNKGTITGANGVAAGGSSGAGVIYNSVTIAGTHGRGIILSDGGTITNASSGVIQSTGLYAAIENLGSAATTITNYGTITGDTGILLSGTYNNHIIDSGTIIGTGGTAVSLGGGDDSLTFNPGQLYIQGIVDGGIGFNNAEFTSATSNGTLTGSSADFVQINATIDPGAYWTFAGTETIDQTSSLAVYGTLSILGTLTNNGGIRSIDSVLVVGSLVNDGTIDVAQEYTGLQLYPGTSYLLNQADGLIERVLGGSTAGRDALINGLSSTSLNTVTIVNLGTITNTLAGSAIVLADSGYIVNGSAAIGGDAATIYAVDNTIYIGSLDSTITNYGTIRSAATAGSTAIVLAQGGSVSNTGTITGGTFSNGVQIRAYGGTITNSGTINSADNTQYGVSLLAGGRISNTSTGYIAGALINGGTLYNDGRVTSAEFYGVKSDFSAGTVVNTGTIYGVNNAIRLSAGGYVSVASTGTVAALNFAGIKFSGSAGTLLNDGIVAGGTVAPNYGSVSNPYPDADGNFGVQVEAGGTITNFIDGYIVGGVGAVFRYDPGTVVNHGIIVGTYGAAIKLTAGGTITNDGSIDGGDHASAISGGTATAASVINLAQGTITAGLNRNAVSLADGSYVYNHYQGLIRGDNYGVRISGTSGTVINYGGIVSDSSYNYGVSLGGGELTNASTGYIYGGVVVRSAAGTIHNAGAIYDLFPADVYGIALAHGGSVFNTGTIAANATGVGLAESGYVYNGGVIAALKFGIAMTASGDGTIVNNGTANETYSGAVAFDAGIYVKGGATIINKSGGLAEGGRFGIDIRGGSASTIINDGTIYGGAGIGLYGTTANRTIIDSGTITGYYGEAVIMAGSGNSTLVLEKGYAINGAVVARPGVNAALELRGNSAAPVIVTYNALDLVGVYLVGFTKGDSNYATLSITNTFSLPGTIFGFTGINDAIDLTQTALDNSGNDATASFNGGTNVLTVTAGGASVELQLDAEAYSGFTVTSDGSNGTLIHPRESSGGGGGGGGGSPQVISVTTAPLSGTVGTGRLVTISLGLDAAVTVSGGTPTLSLNDGGTAIYNAAASTSTMLVFDYIVAAGQNTPALAVTTVNYNGASIIDAQGDSVDFSAAIRSFTSLAVAGLPPGDFNGDGVSNVLFYNSTNGDTGYWLTDANGNVVGFHDYGLASTAYPIAGIGDFSGDNLPDILFNNPLTGDTGYWITNASGQVTGFHEFASAAAGYQVAGVADFTGDGITDVLLYNAATGETGYWITDGNGQVTGFNDFGNGDTAYQIVGTADFDREGKADVLWHNATTGDTGYWITNASGQVTGFRDFGLGNTQYQIAGVADFDGDGVPDILWHDPTTGDTGYWIANASGQVTGFHDFGLGNTQYQIAGIGDYNGDGRPDILWQNATTGDTGYWITNSSGQVTGFHDFGNANTAYQVIPP